MPVDEPPLPDDIDLKSLPRAVRGELRGLSEEAAEFVGAHLLMAGRLIDDDPETAYAHALAARSRAPRLPIVREAAAETAYAAERYQQALTEFRTIRRMSGDDDYLPAMADCERALGRPHEALKLIKQGLPGARDVSQLVELRLVEAGVRADLGQNNEALRLLRAEIESIGPHAPKLARARLRYAYADHLEQAGDAAAAERWFASAALLDVDGTTDASERLAALQGVTIDYDEDEDFSLDEVDAVGEEPDAARQPQADDSGQDEAADE